MNKLILYCYVIIGIFLFACQKEERELINSEDTTIPKDSQLARLIKNVVTHDGSYDDVVDNSNCFSINLPYTVILNGNEILIEKIEDYNNLLNSSVIEIQFPIRITLFNYREEFIVDKEMLDFFVKSCNVIDDDIECIDFIYPLRFSIFNSTTNQLKTIDIEHDAMLFKFITSLDDTISVSANYPINTVLYTGQTHGVQHNEDLISSIINVATLCNENDN